ncbi:hypothetical protein C9413_15225 [Rhizobium sp. SEMIA 4085]|uniref:Uncharacterized protein n=1 Tax=Rhizobium gallicum bv. gallicum R602sp TaxID=1041138 RepID=A0A0B4X4C7_9HYPH|nr:MULTISPECIES: hypothetical protein [Rhizobium]AJD41358.1 hypothetical protein RGR602_CH02030 [Rhizobium gallicum bv. gallicum R602sp]NNH30809.1 hypothetical protein [Rhizobium sp. SEMIA 4085]
MLKPASQPTALSEISKHQDVPVLDSIIIYDPMPEGAGVELIRIFNAARDYHRYFDD